jgi:uracil-DNA glycosylase family 4
MSLDLDDRQRAMLQEMGVHVWLPSAEPEQVVAPSIPPSPPPTASPRAGPAAVVVAPPVSVGGYPNGGVRNPTVAVPVAVNASVLQGEDAPALRAAAASCSACGLCVGRKHSTLHLPDAPVQTDWLVLGDPPDADEDRLGQPFVEQTGVLLDNMLKAAGVSRTGQGRQGAHLSNVVKCRPPVGRLPQAADLAQCAPFLLREMELVQPKVILAMGRFATQLALQEHAQDAALPLDKQRGRVYRYRGIPVVVTYHPTALLRTSANKAKAWADLCLAMDTLEPPASLQ